MISRAYHARALAHAARPQAEPVIAPRPAVVRRLEELEVGKRLLSGPRSCCPTIGEVQAAVAAVTGISLEDMKGHARDRRLVRPRQLAMWLADAMTDATLPQIGRHFDRDHTTILYGRRSVARLLAAKDREPRATLRRAIRHVALAVEARDWAARTSHAQINTTGEPA